MRSPIRSKLGSTALLAVLAVVILAMLGAGPPSVAPGASGDHAVIYLGQAADTDGTLVEGYAVVHYKRGFGKPDGTPGGGNGKGGGGGKNTCFSVLASGARWKSVEPYVVVDDLDLRAAIDAGIGEWESHTAADIFGDLAAGDVDGIDTSAPDGDNEVLYGPLDPGVIAVTITWGIFRGPPSGRELVEWDMQFDNVQFDFGDATVDPVVMDLLNISVHELGHALGLGHPEDSCTEETMYRFASEGETKKRDLNSGDIAGLQSLYGS